MIEKECFDYIKRSDRLGFKFISIILFGMLIGVLVSSFDENLGLKMLIGVVVLGLIFCVFAHIRNIREFKRWENKK